MYGELGSRPVPQPGSDAAPLSGMTRTSAEYPSDAELAAVGYTLSGVNQFATELEEAFAQLAQEHSETLEKLGVTEEMLMNPDILARYIIDYNTAVDPRFLSYVADLMDAYEAQRQPQQQQQQRQPAGVYSGGNQGVQQTMQQFPQVGYGNSMVSPEMISRGEPQRIQPMGMMGVPNHLAGGVQQQVQQPVAQMPVDQSGRPVAPQMPQAQGSGALNPEAVWNDLRQVYQARPQDAWKVAQQIENQYGSRAFAKPLIYN